MNLLQFALALLLFGGLSYFFAQKIKAMRDEKCENEALPEALQLQNQLELQVSAYRTELVELADLQASAVSDETLLYVTNAQSATPSTKCCSA